MATDESNERSAGNDRRTPPRHGTCAQVLMLLLLLPICVGLYSIAVMRYQRASATVVSQDNSTLAIARRVQHLRLHDSFVLTVWDLDHGTCKAHFPLRKITTGTLSDRGDQFIGYITGSRSRWGVIDLTNPDPRIDRTITLPDCAGMIRWVDDDKRLLYRDIHAQDVLFDLHDDAATVLHAPKPVALFWLNDNVAMDFNSQRMFRRDAASMTLIGEVDELLTAETYAIPDCDPSFVCVVPDDLPSFLWNRKTNGFVPRIRGEDGSFYEVRGRGKVIRFHQAAKSEFTTVDHIDLVSGNIRSVQFPSGQDVWNEYLGNRNEFIHLERMGGAHLYDLSGESRVIIPNTYRSWQLWVALVVLVAGVWWIAWVRVFRQQHRFKPLCDVALLHLMTLGTGGWRLVTDPYPYPAVFNNIGGVLFLGSGVSAVALFALWFVFGTTRLSLRLVAMVLVAIAVFASAGYLLTRIGLSVSGTAVYLAIGLSAPWVMLTIAKKLGVRLVFCTLDDETTNVAPRHKNYSLRDLLLGVFGVAILLAILRHQRFDPIDLGVAMPYMLQMLVIATLATVSFWVMLGNSRVVLWLAVVSLCLPAARVLATSAGLITTFDYWHWYAMFLTVMTVTSLSCFALRANGIRFQKSIRSEYKQTS